MDKQMSGLGFRFMSFGFNFRDLFAPRGKILEEAGIEPGFSVLDYGCGPGSYIAAASELVGESGRVFALDIHPLAVRKVRQLASKKRLDNVEAIQSDRETGLPGDSVDVVLLYDTLHKLDEPNAVLGELNRVLKLGGTLSFSDHHMNEDEASSAVTSGGLFRFSGKGKKTYSFISEG